MRLEVTRPAERRAADFAHVGLHGRVLARVRPEVGRARERGFTLGAAERLLPPVLLQVHCQVALGGERGFAVRALERLAVAVDAHVDSQAGGLREHLSTLRALELFPGLRRLAVAVVDVLPQAGCGGEPQRAVAAHVVFLCRGVLPHVNSQVVGPGERFLAL